MSLILEAVGSMAEDQMHLADINLTFEKGAFYVVLGATLAGKTSLLRLLSGLDQPTSGAITMDGRNIVEVPVWKRRVSMVYQQFINYPHLDVRANIAFPLHRAGLPGDEIDRRINEVTALLGIGELLRRRPGELSGGQQQRVALARSLVKNADLLLLDEPLVNLDYKLREQLRPEFRSLFGNNTSAIIIYSTTEPLEALMLGGRIVILDEGRVLQTGDVHEAFHNPACETVARVFNDPPMNMISADVTEDRILLGDGLVVPRSGHLAGLPPGPCRIGIRANDLNLEQSAADDMELMAEVQLSEVNGSETYIHIHHNEVSWVVREDGVHSYALGSRIGIRFNPGRLFAFSSADGRLLAAPDNLVSGSAVMEG